MTESSESTLVSSEGQGETPSFDKMRRLLSSLPKVFFPSLIFLKFFLFAVIPPLADNLIPLFFTGNIPNESGLAISSQFTFISIILEVLQEGVGNSLFYFVGTHFKENRPLALVALKLALVILLIGGALLTVLMLLLTPQFVNLIDTPSTIVEETKTFLYISAFSYVPLVLSTGINNYLLITTSSWLVASQLVVVVLSFLTSFFLFGQQSWSLHWGVAELGYYKVIQSTLTLTVNLTFFMIIEKLSPYKFIFTVPFFKELNSRFFSLCRVSWGNFGDSAVRNFFYFFVTLKFFNYLGENEAAAWGLLNGIIWGVILVPGYVVANYAKVSIGHNCSKSRVRRVAKECLRCLLAWICVVSIIAVFCWPSIASFFSKSNEEVQKLSEKMLHNVGWIFIVFACNNAIDSFFFGTGKTEYVFYQSFLTNMLVYFPPWVLYLCGILTPTYWWTMGLYIGGMLVDFGLTSYFCVKVWRNMEYEEHP